MTPRYFIWCQTDREPWRVYNRRKGLPRGCSPCSAIFPWQGDDYLVARNECRKLNAERRREKKNAERKGAG